MNELRVYVTIKHIFTFLVANLQQDLRNANRKKKIVKESDNAYRLKHFKYKQFHFVLSPNTGRDVCGVAETDPEIIFPFYSNCICGTKM